ncbi:abortive infection system antitoxin AbiGi family protein [Aquibacillus rhizosphaerae]|uniref:Abortive infection system antitoxin AbiGi family protein n=1 Tax=Aquibacillus rhizosphaerae TaxID=3051431 RepID=A0ABT7L104_9BACI|nr:abortive infection system antitoxin AbiGi family protein [Aquibacillus sp. LR5S19]MDL4839532.1 abortive infection system antitoxin AbiGi family protein [Aquibacillus sp. LR5S19]
MNKPRYYSNIYWHFTGGPVSNNNTSIWHHYRSLKDVKENSSLRDPKKALNNLKNIIKTKILKATTTELISESVETNEFCCVSDVPLKDLTYHRKYYGDYAIGFTSKKIHEYFHPVLYLDPFYASINNKELGFKKDQQGSEPMLWELIGVKKENPLINFLKITSFSKNYDYSFYGEREWRCLDDFKFKEEDLEAIIVPKDRVEEIHHYLHSNGYHNISLLSWDLIENM